MGQLHLFCRSAGGAADFLLVDARTAPARAALIHRRAWAQRGYRIAPLPDPGSAGASAQAAGLVRYGLPLVLVRDPAGDAPELLGALFELTDDVRALARSRDGQLSLAGEPQLADPASLADASGSTTVVLALDREERLVPVDLPHELELELEGGTRVLGLRLESAHATLLPAPAWWRIEGPDRVKLRVDLTADREGDRWRVSLAEGQLTRVERPAGAGGTAVPPARLAVILDRTCPDEAGWSGARALGVAGRARVADPFAKPGSATDGGHYRDLNAAVRRGLEGALQEQLAGHDVHVDAWAFADVPGDGLAPLEGVDHPDAAVMALGAGPVDRLAGCFGSATYAPGLDVWDPVEEALEQALEPLFADTARRGAVLIVGNSPPQVLAAPGTAFAELARSAGCWTSARRYSPVWDLALERCRAEGIRVAYVFLEHAIFRNDEQREHELFARVARRVREGLEACLPVVRGPASEPGTRRAVAEALALLGKPAPRTCGIRLARVVA